MTVNKEKFMDVTQLQLTWDRFLSRRDTKSHNKLVEHYFPYVKKIATKLSKKYNYKVSAEELTSHGIDGLYRAINYYDRSRMVKFETYSYSRIRGAMIDGIRSEDWVPRSVRLRQAIIDKAKNQAEYLQGHGVHETSVLKNIGINETEYHKKRTKYHAASVVSLENTFCTEIEIDENKKDFNRYLVSENEAPPNSSLIRKEFLSKLMGKKFSEIERKTIYYHYYEGWTMKEIAAKFNISESRMSQIHRAILKQLKIQIKKNSIYFSRDLLSIIIGGNNREQLIK